MSRGLKILYFTLSNFYLPRDFLNGIALVFLYEQIEIFNDNTLTGARASFIIYFYGIFMLFGVLCVFNVDTLLSECLGLKYR